MSLEVISVLKPAGAGYLAPITAATGADALWAVLQGHDAEVAGGRVPPESGVAVRPPTHGRSASGSS